MRFSWKPILLVFLFFLFFYFSFTSRPKLPVRLAGSTAFQPFAEILAETYMAKYPETIIDVQGGGSAVGIMASQQGIVDIGMADMLSLPKDVDHLERVIVARDGIAVIVNRDNKMEDISFETLGKIFSGDIKKWDDLGIKSSAIRVISREDGSGTRKSFDQLVLGKKKLTRDAMFQDSNGTIRESVKNDPNAIGYISIGYLTEDVKPLKIDGYEATNENVINESYKIARPVFLILKSNTSKEARKFLDYMLSSEGQKNIADEGLIPVK
ncbi:hypothetical protein A2773_02250 [Candidatus Gottesmanbacteria bacterium RIFCSPHIGHO2_01_FULL_39_10]|uniref:Phosphate-binding protein n=1 Tax=Candidatus Gottesmanbacteria bacterium RIFCSPHIGHO2_01_FULL_39_10 TaxID=1798375 RepID=A0A1F5ZQ02_9BACT|nr:MAG: hypothetical protein A2773_02250 [Candidatus Gottesmanbacteria bacterium RIFCSPHIGHO2_01_FULL_39_10]